MSPSEFRKLREEKLKLSQPALALRLGLSRMTIIRIEKSKKRAVDLWLQLAMERLSQEAKK